MSNTIRVKRRSSGGAGAPSSLWSGEIAWNEVDDTLYIGKGTGGAGGTATTVETVGGKGAFLTLSGTQTVTGSKTFNTGTVTFSGTVAGTGFDTAVRLSRLDQMTAPTASVSFNSQKITNLLDPTAAQDAATKAYVDAARSGLDLKDSCRLASTANLALSGVPTVDSVQSVIGDRVLAKDQTTGSQNGIYVVAAGAWSRATDADVSAEVTSGMYTYIEEGTNNGSNGYVLTTTNPITLGTTSLTYTQFNGAGQIVAGAGLTKSGNTLNVIGTASRILVNADSIDIDSGYVGQSSITTLGTITTGVWNGTAVDVAHGGSGATTAAGARTNYGLGSIATQSAAAVAITGGTIDNTTLGGTTPAAGTFSSLAVTLSANNYNSTVSGIYAGHLGTGAGQQFVILSDSSRTVGNKAKGLYLNASGGLSISSFADDLTTASSWISFASDSSGNPTSISFSIGGSPVGTINSTGLNQCIIGAQTAAAATFTTCTCTTLDGATVDGGTF